ncbi:hypothetical protein RB195_016085 [Necator americanus]|uniref:Uncharacterized protein n=1 Tax=Necator americanus TaxID=51031 RepID=A0ABR1E7M4_NECAM
MADKPASKKKHVIIAVGSRGYVAHPQVADKGPIADESDFVHVQRRGFIQELPVSGGKKHPPCQTRLYQQQEEDDCTDS